MPHYSRYIPLSMSIMVRKMGYDRNYTTHSRFISRDRLKDFNSHWAEEITKNNLTHVGHLEQLTINLGCIIPSRTPKICFPRYEHNVSGFRSTHSHVPILLSSHGNMDHLPQSDRTQQNAKHCWLNCWNVLLYTIHKTQTDQIETSTRWQLGLASGYHVDG